MTSKYKNLIKIGPDMNHVINPDNVEEWAIEKHVGVFSRLLIDGQNMTVLWTRWEPGASAPEHIHPHEQSGIVLAGQIIFTINGEEHPVYAGELFNIPPSAPHSERNEGAAPAVLIDFFAPVRSDLIQHRFQPKIVGE
jgi:quercetin dioxygenase-like cupin family protein